METYSAFQQANPLSPKKFTKKVIGPIVGWVIIAIVFALLGIALAWTASISTNTSSGWGTYGVVLAIAWLTISIIAILINIFYQKAYIKRYYYDAGESFITIKKGVFAPTEIHVQYGKIQDVYVDQDLMDRVLGIFDVHIASATATSGIEAHIDGVDKETAERIKNFFLNKITNNNVSLPTAAMNATMTPDLGVPSVHLTHEVSSKTYPPSSKYLISTFFSSLVSSSVVLVLFIGKIQLPLKISLTLAITFFVLVLGYTMIWLKNYFFSFEKDMIVLKTRVISTNETHVPYHTIQDVVLRQNITDRILGIATVNIQNATQSGVGRGGNSFSNGITLIAQPIDKANELVEIVRGIMSKTQEGRTGL